MGLHKSFVSTTKLKSDSTKTWNKKNSIQESSSADLDAQNAQITDPKLKTVREQDKAQWMADGPVTVAEFKQIKEA